MANIAIIIDEDFEDSEYSEPHSAFKGRGHSTVHIGLKKGKIVKGKKKGTPVTIDEGISEVSPDNFDALLIPGGYSPDNLRAYPAPVEFARDFIQSGKPVFCICHGAQLLITAKVLNGKTLTGWKSIIQDIINAGGKFVDKEVVIDDNLITSRNPDDLPAFCKACLDRLE